MGANDLNEKYSIEKYATRMEVAEGLHTNLIEPIWRQILDFRKLYARPLPIYDAMSYPFYLTNLDSVQVKAGKISTKISSYIVAFGKLKDGSIAKHTLTHEMLKASLKSVAKLHHIDASEITLTNIVEHKPVDNSYELLVKYLEALEKLLANPYQEIDEEFLANYLAILRGEEGALTSFYRISDTETKASKSLVDKEYDAGVPAHLIEKMMGSLLDYVANKENSIIGRAVATFYMFNYIKPFEDYNYELSCLLAKRVIASTEIEGAAIYIPLELFLTDHSFFGDIFKEVQKTHDFTYAFLHGISLMEESFDTIIDRIIQVNAHSIDVTIKLGDSREKAKEEFGFDIGKDQIEEEKPQFSHSEEVVKPSPVVAETLEEQVSEKELRARESDLLESDPYLKKGQAHFYVRHCTRGKFYTIQQYKKAEGCVYETARTSMDNLAKQGYYRREQIKNKFVYTPINKE